MKRRSVAAILGVVLCASLVVAVPRSSAAGSLSLTGDSLALEGQPPSTLVVLSGNWGGEVLDIAGRTLNTSPPLAVTVGSSPCAAPPTLTVLATDPSTSAVAFEIACVLPVLPAGTWTVTVSLAGETATSTDLVSVPAAPTVTAISGCIDNSDGTTSLCSDVGGTMMRLSGQLPPLGSWDPLVGGRVCTVVSQTYAQASCTLPPGSGAQPLTIAWTGGAPVDTGLTVGYAPPQSLAAPTQVTAAPGDGQATVSWSTAADPAATAYRVTPSAPSGPLPAITFAVPAAGAPATMTGVVGGLANGTAVTFTVAAVDGSQVGPESAPSTAVVPAAVPGAPTGLVAREQHPGPGDQHPGPDRHSGPVGQRPGTFLQHPGTVLLAWAAPASDGGSPITGYTVTPFLDGVAQAPVTATGTSTTLTLNGGGTYVFEVAAVNAVGTGAASAPSVPVYVPGPPAKH